MTGSVERSAVISDCGQYRYELRRTWEPLAEHAVFVMLNPSTADALVDDPTIRRCVGFARSWGCGGIVVANLFALRATDPAILTRTADPIGPENDETLDRLCAGRLVIAAWGASVPDYWRHRPRAVTARLRERGAHLHHLGLTKAGHPRHPLYLSAEAARTPWIAT